MSRVVKIGNNEELQLGLGTWNMGQDASIRVDEIDAIRCGIDLGMNVIDTAEMYSNGPSENIVDEAISNRRENVYLISKVLPSNASYQRSKLACENSLKRLKTDRIDLYLLHWQGYYPFEVTVKAMLEPKDEGKIIDWGVSNIDVDEMEQFFSIKGGNTCVTNEVLYNLTRRRIEYDLIPWSKHHNMALIA